MGAGIAHALLLADADVVLVERDEVAAAAARARVDRAVEASASRGLLKDAAGASRRLELTTKHEHLSNCALVVEAVPEEVALKVATLQAVEAAVDRAAAIATNTSSIALGTLAAGLRHPDRFLGLHFFNPVPASRLVEVVVSSTTNETLVEDARAWVGALGKTPVVVRDAPGFASSRLGVALGLEAIRMVQDGVAAPEDIDAAMTLGYGHPMGPLRLTDLVGLDVRLGIAQYLERELGERFAPPELMVAMVERGELGRKTGQGFYRWDDA
jgi:3-hydroxybutyryl-CoA dehydrogenase